ncbi:MAG: hypothetical protein NC420_07555 [Eubacterium sp.]|nr:hypothetical protein [Eubacterium sp.]
MRIGDLEYLSRSKLPMDRREAEDIQTVEAPELTRKQQQWRKWKNWWYYYKWYVVCGIILLGIVINVTGNYLGWWAKAPDLQIAYVGKAELPADTVSALEDAFALLAADFNGDGEIIVRVNQYLSGLNSTNPEMAQYEYASELSLIGDISDCESYLFLMDDPERFQRQYQLIAAADGSCPGDTDFATEDKVIAWAACPILAGLDLGDYSASILGQEITGSNQELLAGLSIGRRCFFTEDRTDHVDRCAELWDVLYKSCGAM